MLLTAVGKSLLLWFVIFTVLTTLVIVLRFWAIKVKRRALRTDDYMVVFAYINTLTLTCLGWWAIANGLGGHASELTQYELGVQFKLLLAAGVTWLLGTVFCKLSILWLYTCIFPSKRFRYTAWTLMAIIGGYGVSFLCVFLTNCQPISYPWSPVLGGHCRALAVEELTSVSLNMLLDILIVFLPMPPLWKLQMAARTKITISLMFGLGFLVVGIMAWRVRITVNSVIDTTDSVYGVGKISLVSLLELWLGIIVACLPTLAPLLGKYIKPILSKLTGSSDRPAHGRLREAQNTIGGGTGGVNSGFRKKSRRSDRDSYIELGETSHVTTIEATGQASSSAAEEDELRVSELGVIGVTHGIHVHILSQE